MIKARNYLFLAAAATLLLAGCQNGLEEESKGSSNVVTIRCNAGSPSSSRIASYSTEFDQAHFFEAGDQVCVSTDGQEAVVYQCTNADYQTWDEADSSKFLLWTADEMTFKAYYPATEGTSMTSFTLPADQSTTGKIALADYMTYEMTCSNEYSNDIYLDLERKTARVIVNIAGFTDQYNNDQKTVSNVRIYSQYSTIDGYGYGNGDSTAVTPYMQGTGGAGTSYTALVVPGYGDDGATFIQLTDGENNTLTVKGIPELEAGYSYTYNLTVGKNTIQVQSVTVTDWTGATLTGGQAQEQSGASLSLTSPSVGQVIGSDGKNYAAASVPTGVTAVAKICYVSGSNGLALALADEEGTMNWSTAQTTCAAHTPAFTGGTWKLASQDEWNNMISAAGSYSALRDGFSSVGGTNMQSDYYWSSTELEGENDSDRAMHYDFSEDTCSGGYKAYGAYGRACLVFTVEQAAKAPATVTTAPTGAAVVGVGKTTALVSGGAADGGTLMYQMTTTNTKPTSTDGFSATVPTAQTITASGKVYVWYYVKADDTHTDSEIAATAIEVPVADIVWDATNVSDLNVYGTYESYTKDGITLSGNAEQVYAMWYDYEDPTHDGISFSMHESGGFTFTAPTGKAFTKIEMKPQGPAGWDFADLGTGWAFDRDWEKMIYTVTWKDSTAASTVDLLTDADDFPGEYISYIAFYLSE